jgi:hypothetical protein
MPRNTYCNTHQITSARTEEAPAPALCADEGLIALMEQPKKMNGVEPYAYLKDLFTKLANGHLKKDIDALMPWAYAQQAKTLPQIELIAESGMSSQYSKPTK